MTFCRRAFCASRIAALALLVFAIGCDREEKPSTPSPSPATVTKAPSRMDDPEYRKQLKGLATEQNKVANELNEIDRQIAFQRRRARAALPKDATDEQVLAELNSNPTKYPEWKYLIGRRTAAENDMKKRRDEAFATVRERIAREKQEQQAASSAASK